MICLGETMQLFAAPDGTPLAATPAVNAYVGGAESNVASGLAHLGQSVEWFSRLGRDPFGEHIRRFLEDRGIDVGRVVIDESRPTGVYFKDQARGQNEIYYYRAGSAASAMNGADVAGLQLGRRRLCHVSGITAALSPACDGLLERILLQRTSKQCPISFDVNYRARLWDARVAAPRLLELARGADIVVVGRDEADVLWATGAAAGVRELLPDVPQLIVKDAEHGATHFSEGGTVFVPAPSVEVVEPVGAGDAFAAGYLSGWLDGWDVERALRLGHLMAAFTLQHVSDLPTLPPRSTIMEMSALSDTEWDRLSLPAASTLLTPERGDFPWEPTSMSS